ncbi:MULTISPECIES: hypothetical protein [unclassified Microbacterium]|uniref:hypothetical protein n=1 Tax=unclassified Microbacterium TaxID=2609290 RepID=UPI00214B8A66|nr:MULTISPECIES: hypothetical protein [unclassified Microbacterium]MCR2784142.1 hypothetical protein [Microbacterium sp. zg.B96]WIM15022.1 hypothetical protein QNO11_10725 [Microbacterium sp. zg-B96]
MALVSGTNDEAGAINGATQQRRVEDGELDPRTLALGMGEQRILVGGTVQTHRNDPRTGVENRALCVVRDIRDESIDLTSVSDGGEIRRVSRDYALDHLQPAYASAVHGIQGETTDAAVVGPGVDAAGLYVGPDARAAPEGGRDYRSDRCGGNCAGRSRTRCGRRT